MADESRTIEERKRLKQQLVEAEAELAQAQRRVYALRIREYELEKVASDVQTSPANQNDLDPPLKK